MTRLLPHLAITTLAALTMGASVAAYAQTTQPQCGVETWSTDKMTYVTTPCTGGEAQAATGQGAKAPDNCGVETWSTDKMAYVGTPCAAGTTYENPSGKG